MSTPDPKDRTRERPRPATEPHVPLAAVLDHAEGLICLSGCATRGVHDEPSLRALREAFGRERLRVELQRPYGRHDRARNRRLAAWFKCQGGDGERRGGRPTAPRTAAAES